MAEEVTRRGFLAAVAATAAGCAATVRDGDEDGLSSLDEERLQRAVEERYGERLELDPDRKDLIVDARYVESEGFADGHKAYYEELFADHGIDLHWLDHPSGGELYDRERFVEEVSYEEDAILACDGFYDEAVDEVMQEHALQLFFVPGKPEEPHEGLIRSDDNPGRDGDHFFTGYSRGDRAAIGSAPEGEWRRKITLHEMGHLGVDHHYESEGNDGVMGSYEEADFTDAEWRELRESLPNVNGSC
ncbi:MAG: twin-arginine translocation signal domain-containing protein [Candidatus Nanohaloarchaea archaeon]|nr:twin-arginine translocation signal domain-containing protein [Candidatus Nanohaloarchaea archaeon]